MNKVRINNKFLAVITFVVILLTTILSGFKVANLNVRANTSGTTYVGYNFNYRSTFSYTLPDIPTVNYFNSRSIMAADSTDPRPNANYDNSVVEISGVGTGFVIGEHTIMTAAHCVYSEGAYFGTQCTIRIPDANPYTNNGSTVLQAEEVHVPQAYIDYLADDIGSIQDYDYAIILVRASLTETYGCEPYALGMATPDIVNTVPINCKGYYGNTLKYDNGLVTAYNTGEDTDLNSGDIYTMNNLVYNFYVTGKTSGAPVYVRTKYEVGNNDPVYYDTVISIVSTNGRNGYLIDSKAMQFAYNNDYLELL